MLLPKPQKASGSHVQVANFALVSIDVEILHAPDLIAIPVVNVELPDVLLRFFEAEIRVAKLHKFVVA